MDTPPNQRSSGSREPVKTLRDEFAMAALTGLLANPRATVEWINENAVKGACDLADAMMASRSRR